MTAPERSTLYAVIDETTDGRRRVIYETIDPRDAERAVAALEAAGAYGVRAEIVVREEAA